MVPMQLRMQDSFLNRSATLAACSHISWKRASALGRNLERLVALTFTAVDVEVWPQGSQRATASGQDPSGKALAPQNGLPRFIVQ